MATKATNTFGYLAGAAASPATLPTGKTILVFQIRAHSTAGGSMTINGGAAIPIIAGMTLELDFPPGQELVNPALVFTTTDSFYVGYTQGVVNPTTGT